MGNCLGSRLSWVGFLALRDMDLSLFSGVVTRDLFRYKEHKLDQLAELGCTDSLVCRAPSINLEMDKKDKFSKRCGSLQSF